MSENPISVAISADIKFVTAREIRIQTRQQLTAKPRLLGNPPQPDFFAINETLAQRIEGLESRLLG
jgi:hypothetical protein